MGRHRLKKEFFGGKTKCLPFDVQGPFCQSSHISESLTHFSSISFSNSCQIRGYRNVKQQLRESFIGSGWALCHSCMVLARRLKSVEESRHWVKVVLRRTHITNKPQEIMENQSKVTLGDSIYTPLPPFPEAIIVSQPLQPRKGTSGATSWVFDLSFINGKYSLISGMKGACHVPGKTSSKFWW